MRILLVKARPARTHGMASPPLGLMYLSASLKAAGFVGVSILDGSLYSETELHARVEAARADLVGVSAITAEGISLHKIAAAAKRANPLSLVVAGGHYPSTSPEDCLKDPNVDVVAPGEGERAIVSIAWALKKGSPPHGLLPAETGLIEDLDSLPPPDWGGIELEKYSAFVPQTPLLYGRPYMSLFTSRGCPYNCVFCHRLMGKRFRAHSPQRVLSEISALHEKYGIDRFEIADDAFNFDRARAAEIFRLIIASGLKIRIYMCGIRADLLDSGLIGLMKEAGVVYVACGLETGDFALQSGIKKNMDLVKFRENIAALASKGIFTTAGVIYGFEGESLISVLRTIAFIMFSSLHTVMLATLRVYPGTELAASGGRALTPETDLGVYSGFTGNDLPLRRALYLGIVKAVSNLLFYLNPYRLYIIFRDLPERGPGVYRLLAAKFITRTLIPR